MHARLIKEGYNHNFYIIGDGPLKQELVDKITKLNVMKTFILLGQKENPYPYILNSDYFCLFSRYEGFGMVVAEAKALNKSILITDTAAKEALQNYNNKKIFENSEQGIYNGLKYIIQNNKNIKISDSILNTNNNEILNKIKNILGE